MKKRKNVFSMLLLVCLLFSLSGCEQAATAELNEYSFLDETEPTSPPATAGESFLTLWSNQFATAEDIGSYLEKIKGAGYAGIDFCVLWGDFAYEKNRFDWSFVDAALDTITQNGYQLSLNLIFWTNGLSWKDSLELQKTKTGEIYAYNDTVKDFISFHNEGNLEAMREAVLAFAAHCNSRYPGKIAKWGVRASFNGKMEYAATEDLDFSESAVSAFYDYLETQYGEIAVLNEKHAASFDSWDAVRALETAALPGQFAYEWKTFKQQTLRDVQQMAYGCFKAANEAIPVELAVSSFTASACALYSGVYDASGLAADSLRIDTEISDTNRNYFNIDFVSSISGKRISGEIEGGWTGVTEVAKYPEIVSIFGISGADCLQYANWTAGDIETYAEAFRQYPAQFQTEQRREEAVQDDVILINTLDFILRETPTDLYSLYQTAYQKMTGDQKRHVRFCTDTQLRNDPSLLDNIKTLHVGMLDKKVYLYDDLAQLLAEREVSMIDATGQQPQFVNQFGAAIADEIQQKLRSKLT